MRLLKLVPENTNIHFLKWRLPFFVISGKERRAVDVAQIGFEWILHN